MSTIQIELVELSDLELGARKRKNPIEEKTNNSILNPMYSPTSNKPDTKTTNSTLCTNSCSFTKLCCHTLTDTDDLILKSEREAMNKILVDDDETNITKLDCCLDWTFGITLMRRPDCSRRRYGPSHPKKSMDYCGVCYCLTQTCFVLFLILAIFLLFYGISNQCGYRYYMCEDSQNLIANSSDVMEEMSRFEVIQRNTTQVSTKTIQQLPSDLNPKTNPNALKMFLYWKGRTKVFWSGPLFDVLIYVGQAIAFVMIMLSIGLKFQDNDPNELLYPPILKKDVITDDISNETTIMYRLHRSRSTVQQFGILFGALLTFMYILNATTTSASGGLQDIYATSTIFFFSLELGETIWTFIAIFAMFVLSSIFLLGIVIQVHNSTVLANSLILLISEKKEREFSKWFILYKQVIGALHVWSWRTSFMLIGALSVVVLLIVGSLVQLIFVYTTFASEPLIEDEQRIGMFTSAAGPLLTEMFFYSFLLIGLLLFMAMISIRYERLKLLVATIVMPETTLNALNIIHQCNAAYTLVDKPITSRTVIAALKLLFVQVALLVFTAAT